MHVSILAALAAASVSLVEAQSVSLDGFPQCGRGPISAGLKSTPCNLGDFPCICSSGEFVSALTTNVQAACSVADQQTILKIAQGLCSQFGVVLNVPAIAAAQPAAESAAAPSAAQAASSPQAEAATAQTPTAADDTSAEASMDETMTSAPVSPDAFSSSSSSSTPDAVGPTSGPTSMASDAGDAGGAGPPAATMATATMATATMATATSSSTTSTSSLLVYDTKSVVPSATVAMPTDAAAANKQMASSSSTGSSYKSNSTANGTVAASSPMPYMGAAVRSHVQLASMLSMGTLGVVFCWL